MRTIQTIGAHGALFVFMDKSGRINNFFFPINELPLGPKS